MMMIGDAIDLDVMERARTLVHGWEDGQGMDHPLVADAARALQQYGDERAQRAVELGREASGLAARAARRWARAAAIRECANAVFRAGDKEVILALLDDEAQPQEGEPT